MFDFVQRRLRDVDVAAFDQFGHLSIEEGQQQRTNVCAIHVRVGHDDDAVVAQFFHVVVFFANARAQRGNQRDHLLAGEHFVKAGFFHVQNFAFERQNRLVFAIAPLFGRTARRVTLDDEDFGQSRIFFLTVSQFTRQTHTVQNAFATRHFTRTTCSIARPRGFNNFVTNDFGFVRVFLQKVVQCAADNFFHRQAHFGRNQFVFGLRGEFRLGYFDREHTGQTFAHIVTRRFDFGFFGKIVFLDVFVHDARHGCAQAGQMRTAIPLRNVVGKAQNAFVVRVIPLHRDFNRDIVFLANGVKYFRV